MYREIFFFPENLVVIYYSVNGWKKAQAGVTSHY